MDFTKPLQGIIVRRTAATNSTYPKAGVQWLNWHLCLYLTNSSFFSFGKESSSNISCLICWCFWTNLNPSSIILFVSFSIIHFFTKLLIIFPINQVYLNLTALFIFLYHQYQMLLIYHLLNNPYSLV